MYKFDLTYIFLFERSVDAVFKLFVDCYINGILDDHHIKTTGVSYFNNYLEDNWIASSCP